MTVEEALDREELWRGVYIVHGPPLSPPVEACFALAAEVRQLRESLINIRTQISSGTPTNVLWVLANNALRGEEE